MKSSKLDKFEKKLAAKKLAAENPQPAKEPEEFVPMEYNYLFCIFDQKRQFESLEHNLAFMKKHYGFDVFEREYVVDLKGLVQMIGEKVWLGGQCINCNRGFKSREACINHMIDLRHTRINYDDEAILEEMDPYYDYSKSYEKFEQDLKKRYSDRLEKIQQKALLNAPTVTAALNDKDSDNEGDDDDWYDDEAEDSSEVDEDDLEAQLSGRYLRKEAKKLLAKYGLEPIRRTEDGFLRLMDGKEIAPRSAHRIMKSRPGELLALKEAQSEGGKLHGLKQRLMLTDGSHGNSVNIRSKEELKDIVKHHRRELKKIMQVGCASNKFTRSAPEPQKMMM